MKRRKGNIKIVEGLAPFMRSFFRSLTILHQLFPTGHRAHASAREQPRCRYCVEQGVRYSRTWKSSVTTEAHIDFKFTKIEHYVNETLNISFFNAIQMRCLRLGVSCASSLRLSFAIYHLIGRRWDLRVACSCYRQPQIGRAPSDL